MNKFKVGDKVILKDNKYDKGKIREVLRVEFRKEKNVQAYFYDLGGFNLFHEYDLEHYKTPHERLLELGWIIDKDNTNPANLEFYYKNNKVLIIDKALKVIKTLYDIDLQLAEILVDYLKELENEQR